MVLNTHKQTLINLTGLLQKAVGCPVIKSNQHTPVPAYPYVSFTVVNPLVATGGTWGECDDGMERKEFKQVWSFTVQSDDDTVATEKAMRLYEYFDRKNHELEEIGVMVVRLSNMSNRDNFISVQYEYRYGFDVIFAFMRKNTDVISDVELVPVEIEYKEMRE